MQSFPLVNALYWILNVETLRDDDKVRFTHYSSPVFFSTNHEAPFFILDCLGISVSFPPRFVPLTGFIIFVDLLTISISWSALDPIGGQY